MCVNVCVQKKTEIRCYIVAGIFYLHLQYYKNNILKYGSQINQF